jgi:IclR family acetate operon transcriptional repressor
VARALDLLEALAPVDDAGLVELAERAGLLPSTAHRLLATLRERGYVVQDPATGRYRMSHKVVELGGNVRQRTMRLRAVARPHMERARKVCGETVNLVVLDSEGQIAYVDQLRGRQPRRMFMDSGRRFPAHTAAAGKALLAHWPERQLSARYGGHEFEPLTPQTITSVAELQGELEGVRRRGFALDNEEHEAGVSCVAAAIVDPAGAARAAISVAGPTERLRSTGMDELGELLSLTVEELGADLRAA